MKRALLPAVAAAILASTGCAQQSSGQIATVDMIRIQSNWPKFINYQNQLASDAAAIDHSNASPKQKALQVEALRSKQFNMQNEIAVDIHDAAAQIANDRHFQLVVTRQFVGYGGTDITPDVEKLLKITEQPPPKS